MLNEPFLKAIPIIDTLERAGYEAYFVGGCVRDFLLDRNIKDIDIATSALPEEVQSLFDKVIPTGLKHGTVTVRYGHESYEVTTYRVEQTYSNQRHPDEVQFIRHIEEDLKRRDFTMNAFAMNKSSEIIDLFAGKEDIANKIIRTVGNANERFKEDPLRMMRAIRFVSQLGFSIERATMHEIIVLKREIETIAIERIKEEMEQFFKGNHVQQGWEILIKTRLYEHLPVFKHHKNLINKVPKFLTPFDSFAEVIAMLHDIDQNITIEDWTKQWKCSNKTKNSAKNIYHALVKFKQSGMNPWLVYQLDKSNFSAFIHLIKLLNIDINLSYHDMIKTYEQLPIKNRHEININGDDILLLYPNYKRGSWIQKMLSQIEKKIVEGKLQNRKSKLKEWILCHPPEVN